MGMNGSIHLNYTYRDLIVKILTCTILHLGPSIVIQNLENPTLFYTIPHNFRDSCKDFA